MGKLLLKCQNCNFYTFSIPDLTDEVNEKKCVRCGGVLKTPHPPKFSLDNKYSKYLREIKKEHNQKI